MNYNNNNPQCHNKQPTVLVKPWHSKIFILFMSQSNIICREALPHVDIQETQFLPSGDSIILYSPQTFHWILDLRPIDEGTGRACRSHSPFLNT